MKIRMIVSAPLLALLLSVGCSSQKTAPSTAEAGYDSNTFCLNGGRNQKYSCDPSLASAQPDMRPDEIDEDWMYRTLGEIKQWIDQLKQEAGSTTEPP